MNRRTAKGSFSDDLASLEAGGDKDMAKGPGFLRKNWMLVGVACAIVAAKVDPSIGAKTGPLHPDVTVKYGAVFLIFFLSGVALKPRQLAGAVANLPLHALIQGFTLGLVPLVVTFIVAPTLRAASFHRWLLQGVVAVSCMPPPVSSAVILTKAAGGNEAAAIFNSAFGSLLGVFVTPIELVLALFVTVLVPLACGQLARPRLEAWLERAKPPLSEVGQCTLLLIIYTTFCDSFGAAAGKQAQSRAAMAATAVVVVALQGLFMAALFFVTTSTALWQKPFPPGDVICAVFCASHKSLTLGIPVLRIVFPDHPCLPMLSAPLLMYHPIQIVLGGLLVPSIRSWADRVAAAQKLGDAETV
ncbi:symporter [Aureococcus anophagefferens]|nr:symporter [Aureococcus anophagefferens]